MKKFSRVTAAFILQKVGVKMFYSSFPAEARQITAQIIKQWDVKDIYVGCSGNFAIERCLKHLTNAKLHSNDVTAYGCILGRYFSGKPLNVKMQKNYSGRMRFVEKYLDDGAGTVSVMLLLSRMGVYLCTKPNAYYERMINAYVNQFDKLFNATKKKIEKIEPFVDSFYEGDVCEWIDKVPETAGFICYPPLFAGEADKMFRVMSEIFDWNSPQCESLNNERLRDMFSKLIKRDFFMFGTNIGFDEYKPYLAGVCQKTNRGDSLYIYAKTNKSVLVAPRQKVEPLLVSRLGKDEQLGKSMSLIRLTKEQFQALRSQYLNIHINPGKASLLIGVLVDDKLIGAFAFNIAAGFADVNKYIDTPHVYLLCDFSITPTKYKRLSKLVLYAALSKESKEITEQFANQRFLSVVTSAFSQKPVSMKYRGLFRLLSKKAISDMNDTETDISKNYYSNGYILNYGAAFGQWTLNEGLEIWRSKHGEECEKSVNPTPKGGGL